MATWSGIRNKLENEYLAHSLRGHIQYFSAAYSKSPDHKGRFCVRYDGEEIFKTDYYDWDMTSWRRDIELWDEYPDKSKLECWNIAKKETIDSGKFPPYIFYDSFNEFDNQSIEKSLCSENAVVRMLAILDRRVGKRRLIAMKDTIKNEPGWIQKFYRLRMNAENLLTEDEVEKREQIKGTMLMTTFETIKELIAQADKAIKEERFDDLINFYTDDAVLVVMPGKEVHGKAAIKEAFIKIAAYFKNSVVPTQGKMLMLETEDTVLVLSQTLLDADNRDTSEFSMDRRATYVYRKVSDKWLCAIDNSYGTTLLD